MHYGQFYLLALYIFGLASAVFLGRWLGRMPSEQLQLVLSFAGGLLVLALLVIAVIVLPPSGPNHQP
ncbi:hypothetical protein [Pseudomonas aeruginosa]|uniref:hypothetical protein n=1 Tax=Pseudomonas aeruginosa TaxID=287 RepID=UPI0021F1B6C4|nr:hypothetical protein [Pseudomonas aeruginosa]MCV6454926.1 hypothetical protein [Pseudomonas aeruginosa]